MITRFGSMAQSGHSRERVNLARLGEATALQWLIPLERLSRK